jgi:hypothetical protein
MTNRTWYAFLLAEQYWLAAREIALLPMGATIARFLDERGKIITYHAGALYR